MNARTLAGWSGCIMMLMSVIAASAAEPVQVDWVQPGITPVAATLTADQRIAALEREVRALREQVDDKHLSQLLEKKLDALRAELRAEMASAGLPMGGKELRVYWENGLRMQSRDKTIRLKIGGQLFYDLGWFDVSALNDQVEARSARLYIAGVMGRRCAFKVEFDFAGGSARLMDAFVQLRDEVHAKGLNITIGHFKVPFSLEQMTPSRSTTFMERALPVLAIAPGREWGISAGGPMARDRMTAVVAFFRQADDFGAVTDELGYGYAARVTFLPIWQERGRRLLHVGASAVYRSTQDSSTTRFTAYPESHLVPPVLVDTSSIVADGDFLFGGEVAVVVDSFSFQAEYIAVLVDTPESAAENLYFYGVYASGSFFLTGEHRRYDRSTGTFDRIKVKNPFCNGKGMGAWEVAARWSYLDMIDNPTVGGRMKEFTLGVNWYLNDNTRLMLNYLCVDANDTFLADTFHIMQMRVQVDF